MLPRSLLVTVVVLAHVLIGTSAFVPGRFGGVIGSSTTREGPAASLYTGMAPPMSPTVYSSAAGVNEHDTNKSESDRVLRYEQERQDWIDRSVNYYSKVMREERRRSTGQVKEYDTPAYQEDFVLLAKKHYFAIRKVKEGRFNQAEVLYRKIIDELIADEDSCDHAKLAVTTLLLALLTKRMNDPKKTRSVFLHFFKLAVLEKEDNTECACSAKVLCAFALFEMQQGNRLKSLELANKALEFDSTLAPVLQWKQFREAMKRSTKYGKGRNDPLYINA